MVGMTFHMGGNFRKFLLSHPFRIYFFTRNTPLVINVSAFDRSSR